MLLLLADSRLAGKTIFRSEGWELTMQPVMWIVSIRKDEAYDNAASHMYLENP